MSSETCRGRIHLPAIVTGALTPSFARGRCVIWQQVCLYRMDSDLDKPIIFELSSPENAKTEKRTGYMLECKNGAFLFLGLHWA